MGHYAAEMSCPACFETRCRCEITPNPLAGWILVGETLRPQRTADFVRALPYPDREQPDLALLGRPQYPTESIALGARKKLLRQEIRRLRQNADRLEKSLA